MIQIENIYKSFDGHDVLKGVSADLHNGQCNMIIGTSGSGKTVLMKSVIGLHTIDRGQIIYIDEPLSPDPRLFGTTIQGVPPSQNASLRARGGTARNISEMSEKELRLLHREVGMLFQGSALFDSQSVLENVLFPLEMWSDMNRMDMVKRAQFCLERVNIQSVAWNLPPSEISGGMQKRVAIARAIALNPKYLFCDEPNSGLDPKTSLVIDQLIQDVTQEYNICTVINSHDMNSIMEIGDNIIFMKEGVKEWQGSRHDIFHAENQALNDFVFASELFKKIKAVNQ